MAVFAKGCVIHESLLIWGLLNISVCNLTVPSNEVISVNQTLNTNKAKEQPKYSVITCPLNSNLHSNLNMKRVLKGKS